MAGHKRILQVIKTFSLIAGPLGVVAGLVHAFVFVAVARGNQPAQLARLIQQSLVVSFVATGVTILVHLAAAKVSRKQRGDDRP